MRRPAVIVAALCIAASALISGQAGAEAEGACASAGHAGGDWPSLNGSLENARNQSLEATIGTAEASLISLDWAFNPASLGGVGGFQSTPVIANGCVYVTTASGQVYALNADDGGLVWRGDFEETVAGVCCGGTMFAPAVANGVVYINVSHNPTTASDQKGPYVLALDADTGEELWRSDHVAWEDGAYTNSSAVYVNSGDPDSTEDDLIWIGISNPEQDLNQTGGFALVDASPTCTPALMGELGACENAGAGNGGEVLARTRTIPDDQWNDAHMGGGSIWSTAAIDDDLYGYAGTGQPAPWQGPESEFVNAIVKFDVDVNRETFGQIVDVHKGTWDSELRSDSAYYIDVDFAASPTLYTDSNGQQMVAELQKSGMVHAAFTRHMTEAWSTPASPYGTALGNYATTATDGNGNIFVHGAFPGQVLSLDGNTGIPNWAAPAPTLYGANPVTYANGVVWLADGLGVLQAFDAETGALLLARPMQLDIGPSLCLNAGGGVAVARNTVFVTCGEGGTDTGNNGDAGWVLAYRL